VEGELTTLDVLIDMLCTSVWYAS